MWHRKKRLQDGSDRRQQERWAGSVSPHLAGHGPSEGLGLNMGLFGKAKDSVLQEEWQSSVAQQNVFKGYWRWRGEAGFPIKGKAVYRGVCVAPLKSLPQAFSACFRNSNGCGNLCAVRGTREVTTQM